MFKKSIYSSTLPTRVLPVMLSQRMRDVIIFPEHANILSKSGCAICFGRPDTYRFAPFIASLLGLA